MASNPPVSPSSSQSDHTPGKATCQFRKRSSVISMRASVRISWAARHWQDTFRFDPGSILRREVRGDIQRAVAGQGTFGRLREPPHRTGGEAVYVRFAPHLGHSVRNCRYPKADIVSIELWLASILSSPW